MMITIKPKMMYTWLNNSVKTNDSVVMDKPYRKSRKKIIMPSVSPYILNAEIKNTKQCY